MLEELKRIETMMQKCITAQDDKQGHIEGDHLMGDLALALSERLYDDERAYVERICEAYIAATEERWWYA